MELKLDGDAINKYMSEKMLDSALGEQMKIDEDCSQRGF